MCIRPPEEFTNVLQFDGITAALPRHKIFTKPSLDNLFLPSPVVWILPSLLLPRQSFPPWTKLGLPAILLLHGPHLCTWSRRKTEVGSCVATLPTSLHVSLVLLFFLSWINRRGIIKFQSRWRTSRRLPSSTPLGC